MLACCVMGAGGPRMNDRDSVQEGNFCSFSSENNMVMCLEIFILLVWKSGLSIISMSISRLQCSFGAFDGGDSVDLFWGLRVYLCQYPCLPSNHKFGTELAEFSGALRQFLQSKGRGRSSRSSKAP